MLRPGYRMKNDGCSRPKTLAYAPGYRVDRCSCEIINVSVGPITVHMEPTAFLVFAEVIAQSAEQILQPDNTTHPILSLVHGLGSDAVES